MQDQLRPSTQGEFIVPIGTDWRIYCTGEFIVPIGTELNLFLERSNSEMWNFVRSAGCFQD